jgi:hypothetical protein
VQAVCLVCSVFVRKACIHAGFRVFFVSGAIPGAIGAILRSAAAVHGGARRCPAALSLGGSNAKKPSVCKAFAVF